MTNATRSARCALALAAGMLLPAGAQDWPRVFEQGLSAYHAGDGLEAGELWEPCAQAGHPDCQYGLGVLFDDGAASWPANTATALRWLARAARQGQVDAAIRLGFMYAVGRDTLAQSVIDAYVWFSIAVARGSEAAVTHRARVAQLMTEAELESAHRRLLRESIEYRVDPSLPNSSEPLPSDDERE